MAVVETHHQLVDLQVPAAVVLAVIVVVQEQQEQKILVVAQVVAVVMDHLQEAQVALAVQV